MYAPTSIKPPLALAATAAKPLRAQGTRSPGGAVQAVLAVAAATLMSTWALAQWASPSSTLSQDVQAFQQQVATDSLARRYLPSLAPELRHRISEQVRAEQRAGLTPAGNDAFVMRRLALYEEALQQAGNAHAR